MPLVHIHLRAGKPPEYVRYVATAIHEALVATANVPADDRFQIIQEMFSGISSRVQESFSGVRVVRAYVEEQAELERFEVLNQEYIQENLRLAKISGLFNPLLQALVGISFLLVLWMGGMRLASGNINVGTFVMFNTYMGILVWPLIAMGWVANLMERLAATPWDRSSAALGRGWLCLGKR